MARGIAWKVLVGVTVLVVLGLLVAPQTGWLVWAQTASVLHLPMIGAHAEENTTARAKEIAARHPNDYALQYAAALRGSDGTPVQALRALEGRFPNNASLRANILRYACNDIHLNREFNSDMEPVPTPRDMQQDAPNVVAATAALNDATVGKRLDPGNAYFAFMRAFLLYDMHQDAAAQAAVLQAGQCARWNSYSQDEIEAQWQLNRLIDGDAARDAIARSTIAAAQLLPDYAQIRGAARVATYQAIQDEQSGNFAGGIALRQALIHTGGLMRVQSAPLIGSLVGIAIAHIALVRPGGAPRITLPQDYHTNPLAQRQYEAAQVAAYTRFARAHGDEQAAQQAEAEVNAGTQARASISADMYQPYENGLHLLVWQAACLATLVDIVWLVLCGVLAAVFQRRKPMARPLAVLGLLILVGLNWAAMLWSMLGTFVSLAMFNSLSGDGPPLQITPLPLIVIALDVFLPSAVVLATLICLRRIRASQSVLTIALPVLTLVVLLYGSVVLATAQQERIANHALDQRVQGEGQFMAQQSGRPWPGVVD